jgi:hypothetical protein
MFENCVQLIIFNYDKNQGLIINRVFCWNGTCREMIPIFFGSALNTWCFHGLLRFE